MQTIDIEIIKGETYTINLVPVQKIRVKKVKEVRSVKDNEGRYHMVGLATGKSANRIPTPAYNEIFAGKRVVFTKDASKRIGGLLGFAMRLQSTISNIRMYNSKGVKMHNLPPGYMPEMSDFDIYENVEGEVVIVTK